MSRPPGNAHDNAPEACPLVLLLVDVINDFDFPDANSLLRSAVPAARSIAALTRQARGHAIPVIYANDNFGRWRSDLPAVLRHALAAGGRARAIAQLLRPRRGDYLVLKPKHSAFFGSPLELLLRYLRAERVILTGFAGNICVFFTANDLHTRDYRLWVPADCCASNTEVDNAFALAQMKDVLKADIRPSRMLNLRKLRGRVAGARAKRGRSR